MPNGGSDTTYNIVHVTNGVETIVSVANDPLPNESVNVVVAKSGESATDNENSKNATEMVEESSGFIPNEKGSASKSTSSDKIVCRSDKDDKEREQKPVSHANNRGRG